jgi:putative ABC transport system permease protein
MIHVALRGMARRKLRTALTAIAIVLGVALITGTYVLTDSIKGAFGGIFTSVYRGTDATVTGKSAFNLSDNNNTTAPPFAQSLLPKIRHLPDVSDAVGGVGGLAHLIVNGKVVAFGGAPNLGFSVDPTRPELNTLKLVDGNWPGRNQIVIDEATVHKKDLKIGQTIGVQASGPTIPMRISGFVHFGGAASLGGATLSGFDLPTGQRLFQRIGKLDQIRAKAKPGVTPAQLVAEIRAILPPHTQVKTGQGQAKSDAKDTESFLSFLQDFLLAFGAIALFVGAFVIVNSLSITIKQRTRELATLRTLGASRRQVRFSDSASVSSSCSTPSASRCRTTVSSCTPGRWSSPSSSGSSSPSWRAFFLLSAPRGCRRSQPSGKAPSCRPGGSTSTGRLAQRC